MVRAIQFGALIFISLLVAGCSSTPEIIPQIEPIAPGSVSKTQEIMQTLPDEPIDYLIELYPPQQSAAPIKTPRKKLVYGEPKPLICSHPFPAEKNIAKRPNLQVMWEHYLYGGPQAVWAEVGGAVEYNGCLPEDFGGWRNACSVRFSYMLNKAGHRIPHRKGQTVSGENGERYFFRLEDMQTYLIDTYGPPDLDNNDGPGRWQKIPNTPGMLIMRFPGSNFTGHATIWNGAGTVDGTDIAGTRVLFWKLPCFIPEARLSGS